MKKITNVLFVPLMLMFLLAETFYPQTVNTGTEAGATLKAAVQFSSLGSGGNNDIVLGNGELSSPNSSTQTWSLPQNVSFSSLDLMTINAVISSSVSYTFSSAISPLNYIQIELKAAGGGGNPRSITFSDVTINDSISVDTSFTITSGTTSYNITGVDLSTGFDIKGSVTANNPENGINVYLIIRVGYYASADTVSPVASNPLANPNYEEVGTDIVLKANIDDTDKGNSVIDSAEYSLNGIDWFPMDAVDGTFDEVTEDVTATLSELDCGEYKFRIRGYDAANNVSNTVCETFTLYELGSVSGIVDVSGNGVGGVTVKLFALDDDYEIELYVDSTSSAPGGVAGYYEFPGLVPDNYRLGIVVPVGFEEVLTQDVDILICDNDETVNFTLTPVTIANDARGKGYWKHQFDTHIKNKLVGFQETLADLNLFIDRIESNYLTHFGADEIFENNSVEDFEYWSKILSYGGSDMRQKAQGHLATLLFNFASLKISQLEVVTADGNDVSDVITEASLIIKSIPGPSYTNAEKSMLERAKDMCEYVNNQKIVPAGWVTDHNTLYKTGQFISLPTEYALFNNYPNPFNPSTIITYALPQDGFVSLKIYDILGKEVAEIVNEKQSAGIHLVSFDAARLTSGVYLYKIQAENFIQTKKMILMK